MERYTQDRIINHSAEGYPGPWLGKQRVYQLADDAKADKDWFSVREHVIDADGKRVPDSFFFVDSVLAGSRDFLDMAPDEPILFVKRYK